MIKLIGKQWGTISIFLITLFGFCIRFYSLTTRSMNIDEITSADISNHTVSYIVQYALTKDSNPPLYYLFAHGSMMLMGGYSVFAVRFPAVIFGTLAIPTVYLIGKQIRNETLGLFVAFLVSFIGPICWYSQEARAYSLVFFAFAGFTYFFVKMFKGDKSRTCIFGISFFAALCLWSHFYSLLPIALCGIILLEREKIATLLSLLCTFLMLSPMLLFFNFDQIRGRTIGHFGDPFWPSWYWLIQWWPNELFGLSWILVIPLIGYSLYRYRDPLLQYFALVGGVTILELVPLSLITNISQRYALLVSPMLLSVALYPVSEWVDNQTSAGRKIAFFTVVIMIFFIINVGSTSPWV